MRRRSSFVHGKRRLPRRHAGVGPRPGLRRALPLQSFRTGRATATPPVRAGGSYTPQGQADLMIGFIAALGLDEPLVVGHFLGLAPVDGARGGPAPPGPRRGADVGLLLSAGPLGLSSSVEGLPVASTGVGPAAGSGPPRLADTSRRMPADSSRDVMFAGRAPPRSASGALTPFAYRERPIGQSERSRGRSFAVRG